LDMGLDSLAAEGVFPLWANLGLQSGPIPG
jgi:hypothetical protein